MVDLPRGTVTFLFTDIEGSTELWERDREGMARVVDRHFALLRQSIDSHGGTLFKSVGDGAQVAFPAAPHALAASLEAQRSLLAEDWSSVGGVRVRMAIHAGEAAPNSAGDYLAPMLNRLSRLLAAGHGGQILVTQAVQQLARGSLPVGIELVDLGEHRLRDLLEPERVFQLRHPDLPDAFPPPRTLEHHPNNLPLQPTPFLGRHRQVAEIAGLLQRSDVRFLTLTGPGGTGKTRLALQAAADLLDVFRDGVFFVPLAPLADPKLVLSSVAGALGIREEGERPLLTRLRDWLARKQLLLVLDNFEHLTDAAPAIGDLLATSPELKVLATSRMPLRLRAEREYPVPPLALPNRNPPPPLEQLTQYEAVRLFIERAQAVTPDFAVDNLSAPAVAEICWRVDGLPLAIELAAARVRMLPPQAMLARLEKRLPLLTGGARDLPERQRTLRETIRWSHDLLGEDEQILFRRLAVFAGGATLEAAEAVANPTADLDVFGALERLVEQSLVRREIGPTGEPRFTMLETIREFGLEQLATTREEDQTRDRHAVYFLHLAERLVPDIHLLESLEQPAQLAVEYDNLRLALLWFDTHDQVEALLRLTAVLAGEWIARGMLREGLDRIERVLGRIRSTASAARVQVLHAAGVMAVYLGNHERAAPFFTEALAVARDVGDPFLIGQAVAFVGWLSYRRGEYQRAEERIGEALRLLDGIPDPVRATPALLIAGDTAMVQEHFAQALPHYQQIIDLNRTAGFGWILCDAQSGLAGVYYCLGDTNQAAILYAESLHRAHAQHITTQFVSAMVGLAAVAAATGDAELGARLLGAAEGLADAIDARLFPRDFPVRQRALAALTTALGEDQLAAHLEAGRSLTMEQAATAAQAIVSEMSALEPARIP